MNLVTSEDEWEPSDAGGKFLRELPAPKPESEDSGERTEYIGGKWTQYRSISAMLMRDIRKFPLLDAQEERGLLLRYAETKDQAVLDRLIQCNLRLVAKRAGMFAARYGMPFLDLFSEGVIGLRKSIRRFDCAVGNKLSTYAVWWIDQCITRYIMSQKAVVRLPYHVQEALRRYSAASRRLMRRTGVPPTDKEVYEEARLTKAEINRLQYGQKREVYIEAPGMNEDGDVAEMDIPDTRPLQDEAMASTHLRDRITERALGILKPKWRAVIVVRFGLRDDPWETDAIAHLLKCKRAEVWRVEEEAFETLGVPPEIMYSRSACERWINSVKLAKLDPRQRFVLQLKHGLPGDGSTLDDIGKAMGNTRELIRQIEERSLEKLRKRIVKDGDGEVRIRDRKNR